MRIFISHSSHDAEKATGICTMLEGEGHSCFIAPRDIRPGREYAEEIINGIIGADALLLLLSEQANQSPHVLREVERAGSSRIPIIVYKLEEVELTRSLEYFLMTNQWIDGSGDPGYRKVKEAFEDKPDHRTDPSDKNLQKRNPQKRNLAEGEKQKKKRKSFGKLAVPALALLLVVGGIGYGAGKMGHAENVMTDSGRQGEGGGAPDADSRMQGADSGMPDPDGRMQSTGNETLNTDSGAPDAAGSGGGVQTAGAVDLRPGASVELGAYDGEPVVWRVLHVSEDEEQLILVSDKILTMKAFDAAESGKYNSDGSQDYWMTEIDDKLLEAHVRGSNLWCDSNIRTWLNSEKENVAYEDQAPTASAMSEKKNGYSNEAGFLHGFTEEERAVLRETEIFTIGNVLMDSMGTETDDRVFLLSQEELKWFGEADISVFAAPTENAAEQDQTGWYEGYSLSLGVEAYPWLLRDPAEDSTSKCMAVGNGYQTEEISPDMLERIEAGVEGFGIRPAICVDRQALTELLTSGRTE